MAFNALSGTISAPDLIATGSFSGSYTGDGSGLQKVLGITNNTSNQGDRRVLFYNKTGNDYSLNANSSFTFDSSNILNIPNTTASAGLNLAGVAAGTAANTSSYLAIDSNNNIVLTSSAEGPPGDGGGISYSRRYISSHATASVSDVLIGISASAPLQLQLPSAAGYSVGQYFTVKDEAGNCNIYNITILSSGSQTIDGVYAVILESPYTAINIYTDGVSRFFIY